MQRQIQLLRQLVLDSQYAVDPAAVAEAILARSRARRDVTGVAFRNDMGAQRNDIRAQPVRSFRPSRHARSFRPCNAKRPGEELLGLALTDGAALERSRF